MTLDNAAVNSRLVVILILIVGLISAVGVIISAVSLGRPMSPSISITQTGNSQPLATDFLRSIPTIRPTTTTTTTTAATAAPVNKRDLSNNYIHGYGGHDDTVWTLAVGYDRGAQQYRTKSGELAGFSVDLVKAVCDAADLRCRLVYDRYQNCWTQAQPTRESVGGQGLFGGWYDACVGWSPTQHRSNVFDFSAPFVQASPAQLFTSPGKNPSRMGISKIGFVRGFAEDYECFNAHATQGTLLPENAVFADTPTEAVELLRTGQVDAIFGSPDDFDAYVGVLLTPVADTEYTCTDGQGQSMMAKKDSEFIDLWNQGFETIKSNGRYQSLCAEAEKHGDFGLVNCIEEEE